MKFEVHEIGIGGSTIWLRVEGQKRSFARLFRLGDEECRGAIDLVLNAPMLAAALVRLLKDHESLVHSDYDGTGDLADMLADVEYAREALKRAGVKP